MGVIKCVEKSSGAPHAKDTVWVPNGDQLYYPYVSSCVTVTLVFENGLLGGHASQVTADEKGDFRQALNLQEVIGRMKKEDPGGEKRGALKRIYFVGLVEVEQWDFAEAMKIIAEKFESPREVEPIKHYRSPAEVVFDNTDKHLYMLESGVATAQNEVEKVAQIKLMGFNEMYYG
ncbi:MAG TPA: hypothetical protein VI260_13710 [Blastocatellia bacterium]|jgi:hypothetical protein